MEKAWREILSKFWNDFTKILQKLGNRFDTCSL
ncbi:hypothetical protein SGGBAA2069_c19170 [Streptococcus gallolyticus subsp. gallolyticus ATCC BAA-2069]|nr:hypothetical protein SGGBAA2069_c19170 [Streptococcus gallolyticus subsp. gallolyticus ATCC BAA-2069]